MNVNNQRDSLNQLNVRNVLCRYPNWRWSLNLVKLFENDDDSPFEFLCLQLLSIK